MKGDEGIAGLPGERVSVTILNLVSSFLSELLISSTTLFLASRVVFYRGRQDSLATLAMKVKSAWL